MTEDEGGGELMSETLEEGTHTLALCFSAGVAGVAGSIEASFIADPDGVLVMALAVGTDL